jgi:hypothetical protein
MPDNRRDFPCFKAQQFDSKNYSSLEKKSRQRREILLSFKGY